MPKKSSPIFIQESSYVDTSQSKYIIYGYIDTDGYMHYIGKDSNGSSDTRHLTHIAASHYKEQRINKYLQTPGVNERLKYIVLCLCADEHTMIQVERMMILFYKSLGQCDKNVAIDIDPEQIEYIADEMKKLAGTLSRN